MQLQKYKKFLDLQAEREKSLDWGKKKASKQKKSQNIWNLLKDFISLQRERNLFRMGAPVGSASNSLK